MTKFDVSQDYDKDGTTDFSSSPSWCVAVFRLGNPVSYSRKDRKSIQGDVVSGALLRKEKPLIITSDILNMSVSGNKGSAIETLNMVLKGERNYLSADAILNGDWIFAWMHTNPVDTKRIIKALNAGEPANDFFSGLKFVGRIHAIRRHKTIQASGVKMVEYHVQGVGFYELQTTFFYDPHLGSYAAQHQEDFPQFLSQIGVDAFKFLNQEYNQMGVWQDNAEHYFDNFIDIVVGEGTKGLEQKNGHDLNVVGADMQGNPIAHSPQFQKRAPYAYLVPMSVATTLGKTTIEQRKGTNHGHQAFGYSDLLTTLTGVQRYETEDSAPHHGFLPKVDVTLNSGNVNRLRCPNRVKSTFLPIEPVFINKPLWSILQQFKNPTINEMYTCIKPDLAGDLMPMIVFRQIPFSTNAIEEKNEMPLTRFLSLPRWKIPTSLIVNEDIGRSDAARYNMVHVYGLPTDYAPQHGSSITDQMARNAPVVDGMSVAVYGLRPYMATVACSINEAVRKSGVSAWAEAIADWTFGAENMLNGTYVCKGIQSPIVKGDNVQVEGIVYHIEGVTHTCGIANGIKYFNTTLMVTNGMPEDQGFENNVAPRYPGFKAPEYSADQGSQNKGDDLVAIESNPGVTQEGA